MEAPPQLEPVTAEPANEETDEWVLLSGYSATDLMWYSLPPEVVVHIFSFLSPKDLCALALVDTHCRSLASDDALWMPMARRRWPGGVLPKDVTTWKRVYSELASEEHGTTMRLVMDKTKFICNAADQEITGTIYLKLASETQIRGLFVFLEGKEYSRHRKGKHTDTKRHTYFSLHKTVAGRFAYQDRSRENIILPAGSHQFPFTVPIPAASDSGAPMERSFNFPDRMVRYEFTARLVRVGIFNFDVSRTCVLDFRRPAPPDDELIASPPALVTHRSSYVFGPQMEIAVTLLRTHWRPGETMSIGLEVLNRSNWAVLSVEADLFLESNTAGYRPLVVCRAPRFRFPFRALGSATTAARESLLFVLPRELMPTVHCRYFTMVWHLAVFVNVELQLTPFTIRVPLEIVEVEHDAK